MTDGLASANSRWCARPLEEMDQPHLNEFLAAWPAD